MENLTEETQYYPFGLTMGGISSKAAGRLDNKKKWNAGSELNTDLGVNLYETFYRSLDPQLGRFWQLDPKPTDFESLYAAMGNNPVLKNDPLGDTIPPSADERRTRGVANGKSWDNIWNGWNKDFSDGMEKGAKKAASFALDMVPYVNAAKGIYEAVSGKDLITNEKLSATTRILGILPYVGKVGKVSKVFSATEKVAATEAKAATKEVTVIGEGVARVENAASKIPVAKILGDMPKFTGSSHQVVSQMMNHNRQWYLKQLRSGNSVIDLGKDLEKKTQGIFYEMEQKMTKNYMLLHPGKINLIKQ